MTEQRGGGEIELPRRAPNKKRDRRPVCPTRSPNASQPAPTPKHRAAAAAAAIILATAPLPAAAGDVVLGAKVFSNTCAACHAGGQNIVEADKTLDKEALERYLAGGFNEKSIVAQVSGSGRAWCGAAPRRRPAAAAVARIARYPVLTQRPRVWGPVLRYGKT